MVDLPKTKDQLLKGQTKLLQESMQLLSKIKLAYDDSVYVPFNLQGDIDELVLTIDAHLYNLRHCDKE